MLTKNVVPQAKSAVEVQITVPWIDVEPRYNEFVTKIAADVEIPGFRKGQAPINMVEQQYAAKIQQEVLQNIMPLFLMDALQGTDIVPIDYPKYQLTAPFNKGSELQFNAVITQRPAIKVGDYKSIRVAKPALKEITTEDLDKVMDDLFKRWKSRNPQHTTDTPDDEFAKAVGGDSLEDLKGKIKADMEAEAKYNNELDFEEAILKEIEKVTEVDLPDILIEDEVNRMLVNLQRRLSDQGLLMDEYLRGQKKTLEGLKAEWRITAQTNVKMELGLSEVARQEGVEISAEELQAEIDKIQDPRVKSQFSAEEPKIQLRHQLRQMKTLNLLKTLIAA